MNPSRGDRVLVVGAGIAGLAAAAALRRVGVRADVFEPAFRPRGGGGLTLWSNAIKALRFLGLEETVLDSAWRRPSWSGRRSSAALPS
jgi:6-hydroxynicotinate 3-monooxygenase